MAVSLVGPESDRHCAILQGRGRRSSKTPDSRLSSRSGLGNGPRSPLKWPRRVRFRPMSLEALLLLLRSGASHGAFQVRHERSSSSRRRPAGLRFHRGSVPRCGSSTRPSRLHESIARSSPCSGRTTVRRDRKRQADPRLDAFRRLPRRPRKPRTWRRLLARVCVFRARAKVSISATSAVEVRTGIC